ncbi:MAG TPA: aspartate aminotransferase family protein [Puia sp.]|nr:aspartate aminotransferase family protein [Puia sp.]
MNQRQLFFQHLAQTSPAPLALEIVRAEGMYLHDASGKAYLDLIGGISVCNTGHRHPDVLEAMRRQMDQYLHILVYGELIQSPQVQYARLLTEQLPANFESVYFTNSGAEAVEGAMKLAKRATGRTQIAGFNKSYHGSTQGALSLLGDEYWRTAFRPLLPDILRLDYNDFAQLNEITNRTACVIVETVQAEAGVIKPAVHRPPSTVNRQLSSVIGHLSSNNFLQSLRQRCDETGALLVMDEVQVGFGRTGSRWAFEQYGVVPDILLLGKALGGGLPLGAFIASKKLMDTLMDRPVLGHITTFGGHPLSCAAGMASLQVILKEKLFEQVSAKEKLFRELLVHPGIKAVRTAGLLIAVEFDSFEMNKQIIDRCIRNGLLTDWFLFASNCLRIAPPLIISEKEIRRASGIILNAIDDR